MTIAVEYCKNSISINWMFDVYVFCLTELDLDSCRHIEHNGFMPLRKLTKLQRLNLYRTSIDDSRILPIVRYEKKLKMKI